MSKHDTKAEIDTSIEELRHMITVIPPNETRIFTLPNGQRYTAKGQELIDTAALVIRFHEAIERGDDEEVLVVAREMGILPEDRGEI